MCCWKQWQLVAKEAGIFVSVANMLTAIMISHYKQELSCQAAWNTKVQKMLGEILSIHKSNTTATCWAGQAMRFAVLEQREQAKV